jgi:hypothetical protein
LPAHCHGYGRHRPSSSSGVGAPSVPPSPGTAPSPSLGAAPPLPLAPLPLPFSQRCPFSSLPQLGPRTSPLLGSRTPPLPFSAAARPEDVTAMLGILTSRCSAGSCGRRGRAEISAGGGRWPAVKASDGTWQHGRREATGGEAGATGAVDKK